MMTKHLSEPVQSEKLHVAPPIGTQPATFDDSGATDPATTNATTSLKAAALRVIERNQQCNQGATELKKECNFSLKNPPQSCSLKKLALNVLKASSDNSPKAKSGDLPVHYDGGTNGIAYGDTEWIRQQLKRLPPLMRKQAIETYSALYQKAYDAEPREYAKESAGRFAGNNWLRLQVESVLKSRRYS